MVRFLHHRPHYWRMKMSKYFVTVDMEIDADNAEEIERMIDRFSEEGFEILNVVAENIDEDYEEDF